MDSSRRAVESYWRSRMIDAATSDEDKVTPVYKLEEVCQLLRSSHVSVVKEVSQFILKRLEHKSAVVKQKALRLIKYAVGKSGVEFRREMQRHSVAVRQLFQYKGQPDPLKGDALNKAVRDAAHEAISIIFSADEQKPAPAEDLNKRIQGFGNTNFEMPSMDKRSFLSEVVGLGSSSIKQGLSSFIQDRALKMDGNGNYKGPNLRRSLTVEAEKSDRCQHVEHYSDVQPSFVVTSNGTTGTWNQDSKFQMDVDNGNSPSIDLASRTCEERLLETVVTSGGIRVQPSRDALQVFLVEAAKLDAVALSLALESKLQSPVWQVRMKALCVLESILRKKDEESFSVVATYFNENEDVVLSCSKSPQASLKEKANKVLSLLGGGKIANMKSHTENPAEADKSVLIEIPDLIDTSDPNNPQEIGDVTKNQSDENIAVATSAPPPLIDDLFGDGLDSVASASEQKSDDDPFADVSFHNNDLFSGMAIDDKAGAGADENGAELFDVFAPASEHLQEQGSYKKDARDVMAGLSINENALLVKQKDFSSYDALKNIFASQNMEANENFMHPVGSTMPFNLPPGAMFNQALSPRPNIYAASSAGPFLSQQQFLEAMTSFQNLGNLNTHNASSHTAGMNRGPSSSLPDIFHQKIPAQTPSAVMMKGSKKEETKAFDFISDHLAAARDRKRMA